MADQSKRVALGIGFLRFAKCSDAGRSRLERAPAGGACSGGLAELVPRGCGGSLLHGYMVPAVRRAALIVYSTYPVNVDNVLQLFRGYPTWEVIIELAIIWACVYLVFRFLQGTRGAGVIKASRS